MEGIMLKLKLQYFGHLMWRVDSLKTTDAGRGLGAGGEGDDRGWDGWMASPTRWMWVWVNSGSWWWTGRPGVLWFMGSQRVGHDWATDLIWLDNNHYTSKYVYVCNQISAIISSNIFSGPFSSFSSVQSLIRVWLFATPWIAARQASLSITISWSSLKLTSIESVMPSSPLILCHPLLLLPPILPASGSFPMSQLFTSGGQCIGVSASASVLPMNIQDWFPLGCTGWLSLQSKGLSSVFSNTTVQKHQFFSAQLSL